MSKQTLAIGSLLALPISLIIDWLVIYTSIPDYQTIFSTLNYFSSFSTTASTTALTISFANAMTGLVYFLVIYAITDAFTTLIIASLKNMERTVRRF